MGDVPAAPNSKVAGDWDHRFELDGTNGGGRVINHVRNWSNNYDQTVGDPDGPWDDWDSLQTVGFYSEWRHDDFTNTDVSGSITVRSNSNIGMAIALIRAENHDLPDDAEDDILYQLHAVIYSDELNTGFQGFGIDNYVLLENFKDDDDNLDEFLTHDYDYGEHQFLIRVFCSRVREDDDGDIEHRYTTYSKWQLCPEITFFQEAHGNQTGRLQWDSVPVLRADLGGSFITDINHWIATTGDSDTDHVTGAYNTRWGFQVRMGHFATVTSSRASDFSFEWLPTPQVVIHYGPQLHENEDWPGGDGGPAEGEGFIYSPGDFPFGYFSGKRKKRWGWLDNQIVEFDDYDDVNDMVNMGQLEVADAPAGRGVVTWGPPDEADPEFLELVGQTLYDQGLDGYNEMVEKLGDRAEEGDYRHWGKIAEAGKWYGQTFVTEWGKVLDNLGIDYDVGNVPGDLWSAINFPRDQFIAGWLSEPGDISSGANTLGLIREAGNIVGNVAGAVAGEAAELDEEGLARKEDLDDFGQFLSNIWNSGTPVDVFLTFTFFRFLKATKLGTAAGSVALAGIRIASQGAGRTGGSEIVDLGDRIIDRGLMNSMNNDDIIDQNAMKEMFANKKAKKEAIDSFGSNFRRRWLELAIKDERELRIWALFGVPGLIDSRMKGRALW